LSISVNVAVYRDYISLNDRGKLWQI